MSALRNLSAVFLACAVLGGSLNEAHAATVAASKISNKLAGRKTASGKRYNPHALTAASKTLPLGSKVAIKNRKTGKRAVVTITDRGPYAKGRGLDLSSAAAAKVGMKSTGKIDVTRKKK
jgi:rare lipoprotein A